ncbi:MAG: low molecular weight protein arginine phosphatase [Candidatus Omnitrophica bacterium]|nr:low molecular weight protein arginine phosphatase [Candidatus Omnitrophota bacterium]
MADKNTRTVLFVCTGNSCRSAMAKGLLEDLVSRRQDELREKVPGVQVVVRSAGVMALPGFAASAGAIEAMRETGIDISFHLTQPLTNEMIDEADLILVMEERHLEEIINRRPGARDKAFLLKIYGLHEEEGGKLADRDVADPIGKPLEGYQCSLAEIREYVERVFEKFILEKE